MFRLAPASYLSPYQQNKEQRTYTGHFDMPSARLTQKAAARSIAASTSRSLFAAQPPQTCRRAMSSATALLRRPQPAFLGSHLQRSYTTGSPSPEQSKKRANERAAIGVRSERRLHSSLLTSLMPPPSASYLLVLHSRSISEPLSSLSSQARASLHISNMSVNKWQHARQPNRPTQRSAVHASGAHSSS